MGFIVSLMLTLLMMVVIGWAILKVIKKIWYQLHEIAGIEVKPAYRRQPQILEHQSSVDIPINITEREKQKINVSLHTQEKHWQTKHGKTSPMTYLTGVSIEKLNLMPTEAVVILSRINEKMSRYTKWRQETLNIQEQWISEKQFAIQRLINDSIPTAVQQYDQLARFNPHKINQKIHGEMTASDMLIQVLLEVDSQLDTLLEELYQQTANQLATTYHYVKSRTQQ